MAQSAERKGKGNTLCALRYAGVTSMTQIRLENITKKFGATTVIRNLNLAINRGEFFTFVGPSGCGKSTVLNMIAGLEPVSGGSIFFDNALVNDISPKDRDVAMVFQSYALYPHMSVYENIAFPLRMRKADREVIAAEITRVADLLGLSEFLTKKPKELSGGQRQRVAFGRAIIRKPNVFLMDEPLSNLDARLRIEMRAELKRLHRELGITMIYVTHDQAEAMGLSDRIAVLNKGEVQQCATPREIYAKPANVFVGGFMGSPPMNLLRCTITTTTPLQIECNGMTFFPKTDSKPGSEKVLAGIRPEDVTLEKARTERSIPVEISVIEPAGPFSWAEVRWKYVKLRAVSKNDEFHPGDTAYINFTQDKIVVFDERSGQRL